MKIALYANEIARSGQRGVKTHSLELFRAMVRQNRGHDLTLFAEKSIKGCFDEPVKEVIIPPRKWWAFRAFAPQMRDFKPEAVLMPIQTYPFWRKSSFKVAVTIHDVAFLHFPEHYTAHGRFLLKFNTRRAARLADHIIVPSKTTRRDLIQFYGVPKEKISVVYHGFSDFLVKKGRVGSVEVFNFTQKSPFLLFVGSVQPRKNLIRLVEAFEILAPGAPELKLVLVGGNGWLFEEILRRIEKSPVKNRIVMTGEVSIELLADFYASAEMLVFPSLYEGFGLPVLEAMSCGLPVVCAKNSSIKEVAGDAAVYFDEYDSKNMADKLKMVYYDADLQEKMQNEGLKRAREFSWEKAAQATWETMENI